MIRSFIIHPDIKSSDPHICTYPMVEFHVLIMVTYQFSEQSNKLDFNESPLSGTKSVAWAFFILLLIIISKNNDDILSNKQCGKVSTFSRDSLPLNKYGFGQVSQAVLLNRLKVWFLLGHLKLS